MIYATLLLALTMLPILMLHGLAGLVLRAAGGRFHCRHTGVAGGGRFDHAAPGADLLRQGQPSRRARPMWSAPKNGTTSVLVRACGKPMLAVIGSVAALIVTVAGPAAVQQRTAAGLPRGPLRARQIAGPPGSLAVGDAQVRRGHQPRSAGHRRRSKSAEQQLGRSEGGEDTWGTETTEFHVELKPKLSGKAQDAIQEEIQAALAGFLSRPADRGADLPGRPHR